MRTNIPSKFDWFSEFATKDDLLCEYGYKRLPEFSEITDLERIDEEYFDFRFHFRAKVLVKKEIKTYHVVLNEDAVLKSFLSQEVKLFNMPKFSAFFR